MNFISGNEIFIIILIHQLIFQGMFLVKNITLRIKLGKPVRGNNKEAILFILLSIVFIGLSFVLSLEKNPFFEYRFLNQIVALVISGILLIVCLFVSAASLMHLKDSWRVGVLEYQQTELISSGIYSKTRNPYFVSYLLIFIAYTMLLQNLILFALGILGFFLIHYMILKEEQYLLSVHGEKYNQYKSRTPRYIIV